MCVCSDDFCQGYSTCLCVCLSVQMISARVTVLGLCICLSSRTISAITRNKTPKRDTIRISALYMGKKGILILNVSFQSYSYFPFMQVLKSAILTLGTCEGSLQLCVSVRTISAIAHNTPLPKNHKNQCPMRMIFKRAFFCKNASFQSYGSFPFIQYLNSPILLHQ